MTIEVNSGRCQKCGASLHKSPDTGELVCLLCSYEPVHEVDSSQIEMFQDPVVEFQRVMREEQKVNNFFQGLESSVKDLYVTKTLIALNIAVFLFLLTKDVNAFSPLSKDLEYWGGNISSSTMFGEPWRLFTCMFLHGGTLHLAMNMLFFWVLGKFIEKIFGHLNYLLLYIFSGILGSLCSLIFNPNVVSVGASGALFGIFGGLAGYLFVCKKYIPPRLFKEIKSNVVTTLGINIIFGMSVPNIDMAAHMGGLAGGFIAALFLSHDLSPKGINTRKKRSVTFSIFAIITLFASYSLLKTQFKTPFEKVFTKFQTLDSFYVNNLNTKLSDARSGTIPKQQLIKFMQRLLKDWKTTYIELKQQKPFGMSNKTQKRLEAYMLLKEEKLQLMIKAIQENNNAYEQRLNEINKELEPFVKN